MTFSSSFAPWSAHCAVVSSTEPKNNHLIIAGNAQNNGHSELICGSTSEPEEAYTQESPRHISTSSTIFPEKKSEALISTTAKQTSKSNITTASHFRSSDEDELALGLKDGPSSTSGGNNDRIPRVDVEPQDKSRDEDICQFVTNLPTDVAPVRRRASIESLVAAIEDEESRRLSALAYLS